MRGKGEKVKVERVDRRGELRTVYYERRQRLAPITGPAPKPRVRNGAKNRTFSSRNFPFPCTRNDFAGHARGL